jgi:hypoxia up-regulated 1
LAGLFCFSYFLKIIFISSFRIELGKSLNTDEAAAMGAVYQAAVLSKGYRVKKFLVKDANQYPINVQFEGSHENSEQKFLDRILFDQNNLYPNRKLMTFNKHLDDFSFDIHYGNLTYLSSTAKRYEEKEQVFLS